MHYHSLSDLYNYRMFVYLISITAIMMFPNQYVMGDVAPTYNLGC